MVARGACVVAPGRGVCMVAPRGCAWLLWGGMCGCSRGACMVAPQGGRGCAWLLLGGMRGCSGGACVVAPRGWACVVALGGCARLLRGACVVALGGCAWDMTRYGDTVNERAVRILLECILVYMEFLLKISNE